LPHIFSLLMSCKNTSFNAHFKAVLISHEFKHTTCYKATAKQDMNIRSKLNHM
jgi:hypothetical protein